MKINGKKIKGNKFAYDGCHKIYIIEDDEDLKKALKIGYDIYDIKEIEEKYNNSCYLKFINTWKLETVVPQFYEEITNFDEEPKKVVFEYEDYE